MVGSDREKNRLCFNTPGSRPSHEDADPLYYYSVSHIVSSLSGRSLCFPTCGWQDFCCVINCYLWSEWTGQKQRKGALMGWNQDCLRQNELHGDIDTLRLYYQVQMIQKPSNSILIILLYSHSKGVLK